MWIGSYKLQRNVYPPDYVTVHIHNHVTDLFVRIEQQLDNKYSVVLDKSIQSESCYLSIFKDGRKVRVSFRNHDGSEKLYDYGVYLWKFKTWKKCEMYFLKKMLPAILESL